MSELEPGHFSRRFSITQQYGLPGWVVLATIVGLGSAALAVSASFGSETMGASVHPALRRPAPLVCTASGDASGAMDQDAFFHDPLRWMSLCP